MMRHYIGRPNVLVDTLSDSKQPILKLTRTKIQRGPRRKL